MSDNTETRLYPMPAPLHDNRFTHGLLADAVRLLEKHGYPRPTNGPDLVALQQALFGFLYASPRTYTHPDVESVGVRDGWADPQTDPACIDWTARQAAAAIPFEVVDGRPVNPCERTDIRYGRNELGHWGEALAADALVTATDAAEGRWLLMVERSDGHGWALPGGMVDPGDESPADAAVRELAEETGLTVPESVGWKVDAPRYVPDPRASDEAWMVTVLARADLGVYPCADDFPPVQGGDDAACAAWLPANTYRELVRCLACLGGLVFPAHRQMLADALGQ